MTADLANSQRANWGVASVLQKRTRELSPALRRAYSREPMGDANEAGVREAIDITEQMLATLRHVLHLLTHDDDSGFKP